jgi:hypothetical protein
MTIDVVVVPIRIDALLLDHDHTVYGPTADFTRLPFWLQADGTYKDFNADSPFLSSSVLARPFDSEGLYLKAGVHLHWALPDPFTRIVTKPPATDRSQTGIANPASNQPDGSMYVPPTPNRWLVTKRTDTTPAIVMAQWIVESDYLFPASTPDKASPGDGAVAFPLFNTDDRDGTARALSESGRAPWRRMGRAVNAAGWTESSTSNPGGYLPRAGRLTALGWGDPSFSVYYPNCHSIFGLFDGDTSDHNNDHDTVYEVIGWHSDADADILAVGSEVFDTAGFLLRRSDATTVSASGPDDAAWQAAVSGALAGANGPKLWRQALENEHGWSLPDTAPVAFRSVFVGRLKVPAKAHWRNAAAGKTGNPVDKLAIANTGTEALSALLATDQPSGGCTAHQTEDRLEAVQLDSLLSAHGVDAGYKLGALRHAKGFAPIDAGTIWTVRPINTSQNDRAPGEAPAPTGPEPSEIEIAVKLDELNRRQAEVDQAAAVLVSMRRRLYADWCLYQGASYPPEEERESLPEADRVAAFLESAALPAVDKAQLALAQAVEDLAAAKAALKHTLPADRELRTRPAPRYWKPADPVLMMAGKGLRATPRHGHGSNTLLSCFAVSASDPFNPASVQAAVAGLAIDTQDWTEEPAWHPFMFEWEAEVQPLAKAGAANLGATGYGPNFLTDSFTLSDGSATGLTAATPETGIATPDLALGSLIPSDLGTSATVVSGRSLLSPHATRVYGQNLSAWLRKHADPSQLPQRAYLETWAPTGQPQPRTMKRLVRDGGALRLLQQEWIMHLGWRDAPPNGASSLALAPRTDADARLTADFNEMKSILLQLGEPERHIQSQALSGFHEALVAQNRVAQLPLADPLSFPGKRGLVDKVRAAVGRHTLTSPMPEKAFLPMRAGRMTISRVRVVDTFGQTQDLVNRGEAAQKGLRSAMSYGGEHAVAGWSWLPPRLCQPARLDFRWLVAGSDSVEMNAHPITSPICGWLLPNNLDGTLQVHDETGTVLGILEPVDVAGNGTAKRLQWRVRPSATRPVYPNTIADPTLRRVVNWLIERESAEAASGQTSSFLDAFLIALDRAQENIHPAEFKAHQSLALLMGRPLAVVRAKLGISLQGLPAADHTWTAFRKDLRRWEMGKRAGDILAAAADTLTKAKAALNSTSPPSDILQQYLTAREQTVRAAQALHELRMVQEPGADPTAGLDLTDPTTDNPPRLPARIDYLTGLVTELKELADAAADGYGRSTDGFEHVKAPVRLGEWKQLEDGLAGYWLQDDKGKLGDTYFASQADTPNSAAIRTHAAGAPFTIPIAPADDPVTVVMLVDPSGPVHATCGLLPTKAISIPPEHYARALRAIQVFFLSAPILTRPDKITLPLPDEPGYRWSFVSQAPGGHWIETQNLARPKPGAHFHDPLHIVEGWLRLDPDPDE